MGANGKDLVDLEINWKYRNFTGDAQNYSYQPKKPTWDAAANGWRNEKNELVDAQGYPLPAVVDKNATPPEPERPSAGPFRVSMGEIHDYRLAIAAEVQTQIFRFEEMRDRIAKYESWVFFAPSPSPDANQGTNGASAFEIYRTGSNYAGKEWKDPDPTKTADTIYNQHRLLQSVGGSIQLVGRLMGLLNDVGQTYAGVDRGSWLDTPESYVELKKP